MEVVLGILGALGLLGAVVWVAKLKVAKDKAVEANKSLPIYRKALKRQHDEITHLHKAIISTAGPDKLADILNRMHQDDNGK